MTRVNTTKRIFSFISEIGSLMFMRRTHQRSLINTFDTVASHCHHVGVIAYCLSRMEGLSHEDGIKALAMGVLHDSAESRVGDLDFIAKHYDTRDESKAFSDQFKDLPFRDDLAGLVDEYETRKTSVSKITKDADSLEQLYEEWVLAHLGNKMAERWYLRDYKLRVPHLFTKSAKKIAEEMKTSQPHDWWFEELIEKGFKQEYLTGKKSS